MLCVRQTTAIALVSSFLLSTEAGGRSQSACAVAYAVSAIVQGQCEPGWTDRFWTDGMEEPVRALVTWDRGDGPELYAGGEFETAGRSQAMHVARLVGGEWQSLGNGLNDVVYALAVFDAGDGSGAALYAAGDFTEADGIAASRIARWDGERWSALRGGVNQFVRGLAVWDDGRGPALYATGGFTQADGIVVNGVAKWDGERWSALGSGLSRELPPPVGRALCGVNNGSLYVGGYFSGAGGVSTSNIARWDGTQWYALGEGCNSGVLALAAGVEFGAPVLYAGGTFHRAGGFPARGVARWSGAQWGPLAGGLHDGSSTGYVSSLMIADDGSGPLLYAGGYFRYTGNWLPRRNLARWDGSAWFDVGGGTDRAVLAMTPLPEDDGGGLIAAGGFTSAGSLSANRVAKWSGAEWARLADTNGVAGTVYALHSVSTGRARGLYVGGDVRSAGEVAVSGIAKWNDGSWSALGEGVTGDDGYVTAIQAFDDGSGEKVYVGGIFTSAGGVPATALAAWDGDNWTVPPGALAAPGWSGPAVWALARFDDGSGTKLAVGGRIGTIGGMVVRDVALWDGQVWTRLGTGLDMAPRALAAHDDGSGPRLYAAGYTGGGSVYRWDGDRWTALDMIASTAGLSALRGGLFRGAPALFAGGSDMGRGSGILFNGVAGWDGSGWYRLGIGTCDGDGYGCWYVRALAVFDDGLGERLYAGGGGLSGWDGHQWMDVGGGVDSYVNALTVFDDGTGPSLWVGGEFGTAGGRPTGRIAQWRGCVPCRADWDESGTLDSADFVAFLADFFAGAPRADFNSSGSTDSQDFFEFVAVFFEGCP